jgi:hypothetical protein
LAIGPVVLLHVPKHDATELTEWTIRGLNNQRGCASLTDVHVLVFVFRLEMQGAAAAELDDLDGPESTSSEEDQYEEEDEEEEEDIDIF